MTNQTNKPTDAELHSILDGSYSDELWNRYSAWAKAVGCEVVAAELDRVSP